jgi:hypothetical protein
MSKLICVVFHAIVLKRKENTDILIKADDEIKFGMHTIFLFLVIKAFLT